MSRIDTPRTNTAPRQWSSLLPEHTPRTVDTDEDYSRVNTITRWTPKHDHNLSSQRSRDFGTSVYGHQSQILEPEKIENPLDMLQKRAIQRTDEIARLTAELDSVYKRKEQIRKDAWPMNTKPNVGF